jgi:NADH-quinone oxidoreductase subunit F
MVELSALSYNPRILFQKALAKPESALTDTGIWLCAWCYRCHTLCPQGLRLPEIFQQLKREAASRGLLDGFREALPVIGEKIPFPIICMHSCFHPERAKINEMELTTAFKELRKRRRVRKKERLNQPAGKVAIIGSGPAGLTAAEELAIAGFLVTIFEAMPVAGGMLRKGMPLYRMPREVLDEEVLRLKELGVEFRYNTKVGSDIDFTEIWEEGFRAIFVAVGAHESGKLGIGGEKLDGVFDALAFLWRTNKGEKLSLGKRIVVIGGGNVAIDAARTALSQVVEEVTVLYRRSREQMPANPWEVVEAEKEGVRMRFLVAPSEILGEHGKVQGLKCARMELGEMDETGRRRAIRIENSDFILEVDTIIVAIGEKAQTSFLPDEVELDKSKRIRINPVTMKTSMEGVFAGGDCVTGSDSVIEANLAGKRTAKSIQQYMTQITGTEHGNRGKKS